MKKKQKRGARHKAKAEVVEFVSLPRAAIYIKVQDTLNQLLALARHRNRYIDTKETYARALPRLIDGANRRLHPQGLHLDLEEKGALLLHRADRKTRGTNKRKAERAKEAVQAEFDELAKALVEATR